MVKVALLGSGRLGSVVARGLRQGKAPGCELAGILGGGSGRAAALAEECGCACAANLEELLALHPDYVIEAATGEALKECCIPILCSGAGLICLSAGAFFDEDFYRNAWEAAERHGSHVYLASGVIGGFDILSAARLCGELHAGLAKRIHSPDSPLCPPPLRELRSCSGSVREVYPTAPSHLNIGVALGLVCGGLDETSLVVETVGDEEDADFFVEAHGRFGTMTLRSSRDNPDCGVHGPELAAWSALAVLRRIVSPITY